MADDVGREREGGREKMTRRGNVEDEEEIQGVGGDGGVERLVDGGSLTSWVKTGHGVHYRDLARETKECYQDQDQAGLTTKQDPAPYFRLFPFSLLTM